jgi:hypothetical protein
MLASNVTVRKLFGNCRGISVGLGQDALCRDCSMLIAINRVAHGVPRLTIRLRMNYFGIAELRWPARLGQAHSVWSLWSV